MTQESSGPSATKIVGMAFLLVAIAGAAALVWLVIGRPGALLAHEHFILSVVVLCVTAAAGLHAAVLLRGGVWKGLVDLMEYAYYLLAVVGVVLFAASVQADRHAFMVSYYGALSQQQIDATVLVPLEGACAKADFAGPLCRWYHAALQAVESEATDDDQAVLKQYDHEWGTSYWIGDRWYPQRDLRTGGPIANPFQAGLEAICSLLKARVAADAFEGSAGDFEVTENQRGLRALLWPCFAALALSIKLTKVTVSTFGLMLE